MKKVGTSGRSGDLGLVQGPYLRAHIDWFRARAQEAGITIHGGSFAGQALAAMEAIASLYGAADPQTDRQLKLLSSYSDFSQLVAVMMGAWPSASSLLAPRLVELTGGPFSISTPGEYSKERNLAFETFMGCLASALDRGFDFEEPDVRFTYLRDRWGIACKVLYSTKRATTRVIEGVKQVEDADCDRGFVLVNVTNLLSHERWQCGRGGRPVEYTDIAQPTGLLAEALKTWVEAVPTKDLYRRATEGRGGPRSKVRAIAFVAQSHAFVRTEATPRPASVSTPIISLYPDRMFRRSVGIEGTLLPLLFYQWNVLVRIGRRSEH